METKVNYNYKFSEFPDFSSEWEHHIYGSYENSHGCGKFTFQVDLIKTKPRIQSMISPNNVILIQ